MTDHLSNNMKAFCAEHDRILAEVKESACDDSFGRMVDDILVVDRELQEMENTIEEIEDRGDAKEIPLLHHLKTKRWYMWNRKRDHLNSLTNQDLREILSSDGYIAVPSTFSKLTNENSVKPMVKRVSRKTKSQAQVRGGSPIAQWRFLKWNNKAFSKWKTKTGKKHRK